MVPLTAIVAIPLFYVYWRRIRRHRQLANDPLRPLSADVLRTMRQSRIATTVFMICWVAAGFLLAARVSPHYSLPIAIIGFVALIKRLSYQARIRKEIGSGP